VTREEVEAYFGRRAVVTLTNGMTFAGTVFEDSLARFGVRCTQTAHLLRYDHVARIRSARADEPDSE
jgi:hypothetical protein